MKKNIIKCVQCVGEEFESNSTIKWGNSKSGKQRYKCRNCGSTFLERYGYRAYHSGIDGNIKSLLKEGCGILSIARLLKISPGTVQRRILQMASEISKPPLVMHQSYEMDEICTYVGMKSNIIWVAYAIRKDTKRVVDFRVGKRTNKTLKPVIETLELSKAICICTDKLNNYRFLIAPTLHITKARCTNYIERKNLTLRTQLKRLSRRTICYSKSLPMLHACLAIYFWG